MKCSTGVVGDGATGVPIADEADKEENTAKPAMAR
jgi:hypothetical protein